MTDGWSLLKKVTCGLTHFQASFEYIVLGVSCEFGVVAST